MSKVRSYWRSFRINASWKRYAGLLCFKIGRYEVYSDRCFVLHLFVRPSHWQLGKANDYEAQYSFGLGPLFLFCWYK